MPALAVPLPCLARLPRRPGGPRGEADWARALRWIVDRQRLREMDERLLRDVGLTREQVARGLPFRR